MTVEYTIQYINKSTQIFHCCKSDVPQYSATKPVKLLFTNIVYPELHFVDLKIAKT